MTIQITDVINDKFIRTFISIYIQNVREKKQRLRIVSAPKARTKKKKKTLDTDIFN